MRIKMVDRTHAQVYENPKVTITFAEKGKDGLVDEVLGMLLHEACGKEE